MIKGLARVLIVLVIFVLLSLPILICYSVDSTKGRLATIILFLVVLLSLLAGLTNVRTNELFLAAATYVTYLSENSISLHIVQVCHGSRCIHIE
jgi:uncharacterized membrane protein YqjE